MSEWWTYRVADLLMFSPRTYYRLFELYNREVWPLQLVMMIAGGWCFVRRDPRLLAPIWIWVAWAFHWERYREILWAAGWFAAAFVVQAMLLVVVKTPPRAAAPQRERIGWALFAVGWLVQPIVGVLITERTLAQVELFGIAPGPTATVTLALLVAVRARVALLIIPLLWIAIGSATAWAMR